METLIQSKTAKITKDKGFDWECRGYYSSLHKTIMSADNIKGAQNRNNIDHRKFAGTPFYSAPTQSSLQKWLREEHNTDVLVNKTLSGLYYYIIWIGGKKIKRKTWDSYETCLEEGLFEALNLI